MTPSPLPGTCPDLRSWPLAMARTLLILLTVISITPALLARPQESAGNEEGDSTEPEIQSSEGPVSVEDPGDDDRIRLRLERIFDSMEQFPACEVRVREGIVFLEGRARGKEHRELAGRVALKTEGVVAVLNDLEVEQFPVEWSAILNHLLHLLIAYLLSIPIAWDRERGDRSAGLRTFPLVSVASCGFMLIALYAIEGSDAQARVLYGVITGIGFIGGGAILKDGGGVRGTATAASLWNTAAIGVAVAWQHFEIALVLCAVNFLTLRLFKRMKPVSGSGEKDGAEKTGD